MPKKSVPKKKIAKKSISNTKKISPAKKPKKVTSAKNIIMSFFEKSGKKRLKKSVKKIVKKSAKKKPAKIVPAKLERHINNPIISPRPYSWESQAAFNPGAIVSGGRVHLFYRALGDDGVSRIGYASSIDGTNFDERLSYPIYIAENYSEAQKHFPFTSPAQLVYDPSIYSSGGGWGGCEDPRTVVIDGTVYITFNMFNGWNSMRVAVISIDESDLLNKKWRWKDFSYLSHEGDRQKNWVLFPEKINGKYAIFHNLDKGDPARVHIAYLNELNTLETPKGDEAPDPQQLPNHEVAWHNRTRSASAPPIKTSEGWLLLYHAMDKNDHSKYKVGALLLDLKDPEKILYRSQNPILEPDEWYENDYKPGIVYASGAVVRDGVLMVYYGGGDKQIAVASIDLEELLESMKKDKVVKLKNRALNK